MDVSSIALSLSPVILTSLQCCALWSLADQFGLRSNTLAVRLMLAGTALLSCVPWHSLTKGGNSTHMSYVLYYSPDSANLVVRMVLEEMGSNMKSDLCLQKDQIEAMSFSN